MSGGAGDEPREPQDASPSELGFELPKPARIRRSRLLVLVLVGVSLLLVAFLVAYLPRRAAQAKLARQTRAQSLALPRVGVVTPKLVRGDLELTLPGDIEPLAETTLYPRADGYVRRYLVDIGAHVKEGQVLAEIETPELDQEIDQARAALEQARASLGQAQANRDYAQISLARFAALRPSGVTSQEELDQKRASAQVASANVTAAQAAIGEQEANLRRLLQGKGFARVEAPFSGVVAARFIDLGTLMTAGNTTPLFRIVADDPVRVFVQVPQEVATSIVIGAHAQVMLREYRDRRFEGLIARTAGALDTATRTLTTEVRVPNPEHVILAGMFANVSLTLARPHPVFELPGTTLYNDARGLRVAYVDAQDTVHFVPITIERDLGSAYWVATGLRGDERVVRLANSALSEGTRVEVAPQAP